MKKHGPPPRRQPVLKQRPELESTQADLAMTYQPDSLLDSEKAQDPPETYDILCYIALSDEIRR